MKNDDSKKNRQSAEITSKPLSDFLLIERINQCPKLASLKSINETLSELLDSEDSFVSQIAEVIRLDPSLTTRVLDLVNSIFWLIQPVLPNACPPQNLPLRLGAMRLTPNFLLISMS